MRKVAYVLLFVVAFLIFKAFYLDSYLARQGEQKSEPAVPPMAEQSASAPEHNASRDQNGSSGPRKAKHTPPYSDMPLEKVGESIAEKIGGRI